jgi:hypothetical protein
MDEPVRITDADLELLLAESHREDPILVRQWRADEAPSDEELDAQILAGLVTP